MDIVGFGFDSIWSDSLAAVGLLIFAMIPMPDVLENVVKELLRIGHLSIFLIVLRYDKYTFFGRSG
jgi:hypothetical protein